MAESYEFEISAKEQALLTKHQLAVFEGRIIHNARPPITEAEKREIENRIEGNIPPELLRLWETSYGGNLDYEIFVQYASGLHPFSFTELFYPNSDDYHTLIGWIEHEEESIQDAYEESGKKWNGKLNVLPFGGFEYLERVYVMTAPASEAGKVLTWSQGLPPAWVGRLNEDSVADTAENIPEFFRLLRHCDDPFGHVGEDDFRHGQGLMEAIKPLESDGAAGKELASRLYELIRSSYSDWKSDLEAGTLFGDEIGENSALENALNTDDLALLEKLNEGGLDFSKRRRGGMNAVDLAGQQSAVNCFDWLIDKGISAERTFEFSTGHLNADQVEKLIKLGAPLSIENIAYAGGQAEHLDAFERLCIYFCEQNPGDRNKLASELATGGNRELEFAKNMRAGNAGSYRTPEETEAQGKALLKISDALQEKVSDTPQEVKRNWFNRLFKFP